MLVYLDTAVLLSLHLFDSKTEIVTQSLNKGNFDFAVSAWGVAESASALGILVRRKEIEAKLATRTQESIELFASECQNFIIDSNCLRLATQWLKDFKLGLRAGDALHAALSKANDVPLVTTDGTLARATKKLRLKCMPL